MEGHLSVRMGDIRGSGNFSIHKSGSRLEDVLKRHIKSLDSLPRIFRNIQLRSNECNWHAAH